MTQIMQIRKYLTRSSPTKYRFLLYASKSDNPINAIANTTNENINKIITFLQKTQSEHFCPPI